MINVTISYTIDNASSVKKHVGAGVVLNSDGGSKGDGLYDGGVSQSPYGKAARRLCREGRQVYHVSVDHTARQYSRFSLIEIFRRMHGFERVPRGAQSKKQRIRMIVTMSHEEKYNHRLKSHIPKELTLQQYEQDLEVWLMNAAWRTRTSGDPLVKLGMLLDGSDDEDDGAISWLSGSDDGSSDDSSEE